MNHRMKVLLVARYYIIEPLGLLHLIGLAKNIDCKVDVELVPDNDFSGLYRRVEEWQPDFVGFQIWTGWHRQTFAACDQVRKMGPKVIIGGPHVTYFTDECAKHADYVVRGDGFRNFRRILQGEIGPGVHFDAEQLAEKFPLPDRDTVYRKYPVLRNSPIRSMITSVGCPFTCSYCYAPEWNKMYGGFKHTQRPVDDIIREGVEIRDQWGAQMIYLQDDIFGFDHKKWLPEFAERWKAEVGIPFHCQIRLELTRHKVGDERLDMFVAAGCTGITLAIESGDAFLREHVLHREMTDALILEGCAKIRSRGMTLRTEQILAVPFSNLETDLSTLDLNNRIGPEMAWTSILAPYQGTEMGDVAKAFGYYKGENDDLSELFFDRSVMRHSKTAKDAIQPVVHAMVEANRALERAARPHESPLQLLEAREVAPGVAEVLARDTRDEFSKKHLPGPKPLCMIEFLSDEENDRYADQIVILQRLFMWFSLVPQARALAEQYLMLAREAWTWSALGKLTKEHFETIGRGEEAKRWVALLIESMGYRSQDELPAIVRDNPYYFVFFPSSAEFARHVAAAGVVHSDAEPGRQFDELGGFARRWLFARSLYRVEPASPPIAH
jgi:anaerobic magnesium-protoporphyrin IX monomethyl ester cyclase